MRGFAGVAESGSARINDAGIVLDSVGSRLFEPICAFVVYVPISVTGILVVSEIQDIVARKNVYLKRKYRLCQDQTIQSC